MIFVKRATLLCLYGFLPYFILPAFPQSENSSLSYTQENIDSSDYLYRRKYQYLDIHLKDETRLLKIALPTFSIGYYKDVVQTGTFNNLGFVLSYERKISKSISFYVEDVNNFSIRTTTGVDYYSYSNSLNWGMRYYLFIDKKIKEGISGDNCNGLYTDILLKGLNGVGKTLRIAEDSRRNETMIKFINAPEIKLSLGLQERLSNFSYFDASFYISYHPHRTEINPSDRVVNNHDFGSYYVYNLFQTTPQYFSLGLDFKIGLAWSKKK